MLLLGAEHPCSTPVSSTLHKYSRAQTRLILAEVWAGNQYATLNSVDYTKSWFHKCVCQHDKRLDNNKEKGATLLPKITH